MSCHKILPYPEQLQIQNAVSNLLNSRRKEIDRGLGFQVKSVRKGKLHMLGIDCVHVLANREQTAWLVMAGSQAT